MSTSDLIYDVIGAAMEVHRELGPRLREPPYENELRIRNYRVDQQRSWPSYYKKQTVGDCFTDLVVNGELVVEVKALTALGDEEMGQILNYVRISAIETGLLLNFKPKSLEVKRVARRNLTTDLRGLSTG
ncbi:MAG: GxxExxY protein [Akkermansiaceae bacterium]|jgi:GxxExxY protein